MDMLTRGSLQTRGDDDPIVQLWAVAAPHAAYICARLALDSQSRV